MEGTLKVRLASFYVEEPHPFLVDQLARVEEQATFGQVLTTDERPEDPAERDPNTHYAVPEQEMKRISYLDGFFSDEELERIDRMAESGLDTQEAARLLSAGPHAEATAMAQLRTAGINADAAATGDAAATSGEKFVDVREMDDTEIADWIGENRPNVDQTIALAQNDRDLAEKVLDAETIATDQDPRAGVERGLEAIIARTDQ